MDRKPRTNGAPILVVEDDANVLQTIRWALEDDGLLVETAGTGRQALVQAAHHRPALVVLDMGLPLIDGDGVAVGLRALQNGNSEIPVLVVTADGHAAAKAQRIGAVGFLSKPFEIEHLLTAVWDALDAV